MKSCELKTRRIKFIDYIVICSNILFFEQYILERGLPGIEPGSVGSKPTMLPLHHNPIICATGLEPVSETLPTSALPIKLQKDLPFSGGTRTRISWSTQ